MARKPKTVKEQIAILDREIENLSVQQIGSSIQAFEKLHVQIMDKQRQRRELERSSAKQTDSSALPEESTNQPQPQP